MLVVTPKRDFNSRAWFESFKVMADWMGKRANNEFAFVSYDAETVSAVERLYGERLTLLRAEMFGNSEAPQKIDHHKIIALYVQLFLENPLFKINGKHHNQFPSGEIMLINELFCFNIMYVVLVEWSGRDFDLLGFKKYKGDFLKLLYYYRKGHTDIDKRRGHFHFTYALAQIVYFIERTFIQ